MNPFTWLFIALLSVDAVRELMGLSSIMGMWGNVARRPRHTRLFQSLMQAGAGQQRGKEQQRDKPTDAVPAVVMPEYPA